METIKPSKGNYDFVAECVHVINAVNENRYYFAIPKEIQHSVFTRWREIDTRFDADTRLRAGTAVSEDTSDMNLFALVSGRQVPYSDKTQLSVVEVLRIIRADHSHVVPTKSIISVVDFADQYERDMRKKRINTINQRMREKKNAFVKEDLISYLYDNDPEVEELMDEFKNLTNKDFEF